METVMLELEMDLLEQRALSGGAAESVWREMMELSTEAAVLLYLAPSEIAEDEPVEGGILSAGESPDTEYENSEEKYTKESFADHQAEPDEEEKSLYERQSEERANQQDETDQDHKEGKEYDN